MDDLKEIRRLLEQLLAAQLVTLAMRAQDRGAKGESLVTKEFMAEAVVQVRRAMAELEGTLVRAPEPTASEDDDAPGSAANIEKAKKMSMKQKRYDLGKGLF